MAPDDISRDPRVYLAEERTYLAWIRTSLALMAFGFVVARFGLFLRELEALHAGPVSAPSVLSLPLGVGLVVLGVLIDIFASWNHVRYVRALNQGSLVVGRPSTLAIALAVILAVAGLTMAFYLGTTNSHPGAPSTNGKEHSSMKTGEGIISKASKYSVPDTLDRVEAALKAKGVKIFVRVDHSGEAEKAGLTMPPTQLLIFGNPKAGTPVMLAAPTAAIDLPLKALAWQDGDGKVWLSYNDPEYLKKRYGLTDDQIKTIVGTGGLLEQALS
jgi:uncharacterized protein (DUF302 family)/uncharacterized membrane protein YidH (DUF202 family)